MLMANVEIWKFTRRWRVETRPLLDVTIHFLPDSFEEAVDFVRLPFRDHFHTTVSRIFHISNDFKAQGYALGRVTKPNPLYPAGKMARSADHRGKSSLSRPLAVELFMRDVIHELIELGLNRV